ncbi:MAG: NADH-quinone oxidoreductase subunit J [Acidobacteriota bacterium]
MEFTFYIAGSIAIVSTLMTITRLNAVHALLYLTLSLLSVAVVFYTLGAELVAALEVIVYAGAIMVLFIFVVMMLNLGPASIVKERELFAPRAWAGPSVLAAILIAQFAWAISHVREGPRTTAFITPKQIGLELYGPYVIGVELASVLLMGALVGAYHLGRRLKDLPEDANARGSDRERAHAGGDLVRAGSGGSAGPAERDLRPDVD